MMEDGYDPRIWTFSQEEDEEVDIGGGAWRTQLNT